MEKNNKWIYVPQRSFANMGFYSLHEWPERWHFLSTTELRKSFYRCNVFVSYSEATK